MVELEVKLWELWGWVSYPGLQLGPGYDEFHFRVYHRLDILSHCMEFVWCISSDLIEGGWLDLFHLQR